MKNPPREWPLDDPRRTPITLRRDYVADGYNDRALARLVADGVLAKPRRGAYVAGSVWRDLDEDGRHAVQARAVVAQAGTELVLSHVSGLVEYGAPTWGMSLDDVHVTRRDRRAGRREAGVCQHRGVLQKSDVVQRNGVAVVAPARLALETTTAADAEVALGVVNHLLHHRFTTLPDLEERYQGMAMWPRTLTTDLVLRLADPRIESLGESRCMHLFFRRGLPAPVPQYEVKDPSGSVVARVDFAWPELGVFVEFDGLVKYEKLLKPGQRASDVVVAEKAREDLVRRITGWRCIRLTWAALERPDRTAAMLHRYLSRVA
ncbi:MAG: hypothetical protein WBP61_08680 [Nocardioides sp.]